MTDHADAFATAVAAELRAQRGRARVTVDALAERTGLAKSTVLNYLNNRRDIPMSAFLDLCTALDVNPREIFAAAEHSLQD